MKNHGILFRETTGNPVFPLNLWQLVHVYYWPRSEGDTVMYLVASLRVYVYALMVEPFDLKPWYLVLGARLCQVQQRAIRVITYM